MVDTEKRNKRQNAWQKENCDRINFVMPKGKKEEIQRAAEQEGIKASEYIRRAVDEKLSRTFSGSFPGSDSIFADEKHISPEIEREKWIDPA